MQPKIQTGLRIPVEQYNKFCLLSDRMGISLNAVVLFLADVGLAAINRGVESGGRGPLRSPKCSGE